MEENSYPGTGRRRVQCDRLLRLKSMFLVVVVKRAPTDRLSVGVVAAVEQANFSLLLVFWQKTKGWAIYKYNNKETALQTVSLLLVLASTTVCSCYRWPTSCYYSKQDKRRQTKPYEIDTTFSHKSFWIPFHHSPFSSSTSKYSTVLHDTSGNTHYYTTKYLYEHLSLSCHH